MGEFLLKGLFFLPFTIPSLTHRATVSCETLIAFANSFTVTVFVSVIFGVSHVLQ